MTPKRYQQSDKLIQWAFLFEEFRPLQTSTCALFWRSVMLTPLKLLGLGPTAFVCLLGFLVLVALFPEWFPVDTRHLRPMLPLWWLPIVIAAAAIVVAIAVSIKLGFWAWLHSFCLPVEIEGGLVQKGICPSPNCMGWLVVSDETQWKCPRCGGVFLPPAPK